eukprot:GILI01008308.1.p1 GENE.GILI01008308.1~~GILI01008308.1.p1  ORF type:complete len:350 (+),score=52.57 GILI01008308.1:93-1142(+)
MVGTVVEKNVDELIHHHSILSRRLSLHLQQSPDPIDFMKLVSKSLPAYVADRSTLLLWQHSHSPSGNGQTKPHSRSLVDDLGLFFPEKPRSFCVLGDEAELQKQKQALLSEVQTLRSQLNNLAANVIFIRLENIAEKRRTCSLFRAVGSWREFNARHASHQKMMGEMERWSALREKDNQEKTKLKSELHDAVTQAHLLRTHRDELARGIVKQEEMLSHLRAEAESFAERYNMEKEMLLQELASCREQLTFHKFPEWIPDDHSDSCMLCSKKFRVYRRRHHCRKCGKLVCDECSQHRLTFPCLGLKDIRSCDRCYKASNKTSSNSPSSPNSFAAPLPLSSSSSTSSNSSS